MLKKRKTDNPPFPVRAGMGEHGLAYVLIENQVTKTPFDGDDEKKAEIRQTTIDAIVDCRAHGMSERNVIANTRRFVRYWFESGLIPDPIGNPAVRLLAHLDDEYPLNGKARFVEIMTGRGFPHKIATTTIADAVHGGLIQERRGRHGVDYRLTHEPRTRAVYDIAEHVAAIIGKYPAGIPFGGLRHIACRLTCGGIGYGAALVERALNAGVLRCEIRGTGRNRERFIFPNVTNKAKGGKSC